MTALALAVPEPTAIAVPEPWPQPPIHGIRLGRTAKRDPDARLLGWLAPLWQRLIVHVWNEAACDLRLPLTGLGGVALVVGSRWLPAASLAAVWLACAGVACVYGVVVAGQPRRVDVGGPWL